MPDSELFGSLDPLPDQLALPLDGAPAAPPAALDAEAPDAEMLEGAPIALDVEAPDLDTTAVGAAELEVEPDAEAEATLPTELEAVAGPTVADDRPIEAEVVGEPEVVEVIDAPFEPEAPAFDAEPEPLLEDAIPELVDVPIPGFVRPSEATPVIEENPNLVGSMPEAARQPRQYFQEEPPTWLAPEFEAQQPRVVSPPLGRSPGRMPAAVLAVLMSGVFAMFLLIEPTPTWLILFGTIIAVVGTDGVLRAIRVEVFGPESGRDTAAHLYLPALFVLTVPLFIEENVPSYLVIPAALVAAVAFVLVVLAEVPAEDEEQDEFHGRARFVSVAVTYFVAFALFSLTYAFDLGLRDSLIPIALGSSLLAFGLLREGEIDHMETLLLACVVGIVVAESRWLLQFMPLDAYPAGLALLLSFYFVTGMVHAYMTRHISTTVAAEYGLVTSLGIAAVIGARVFGVA